MNKYPYPIAMTFNAVTVVIAWILILTFFAVGFLRWFDIHFDLSTNFFILFFLMVILHIIFGTLLKCPECSRRPTVQGFSGIHPEARKVFGMSGWAVVIIDVLFKRSFRCIHCGTDFKL